MHTFFFLHQPEKEWNRMLTKRNRQFLRESFQNSITRKFKYIAIDKRDKQKASIRRGRMRLFSTWSRPNKRVSEVDRFIVCGGGSSRLSLSLLGGGRMVVDRLRMTCCRAEGLGGWGLVYVYSSNSETDWVLSRCQHQLPLTIHRCDVIFCLMPDSFVLASYQFHSNMSLTSFIYHSIFCRNKKKSSVKQNASNVWKFMNFICMQPAWHFVTRAVCIVGASMLRQVAK